MLSPGHITGTILVLGGARSGKSRLGERLVLEADAAPVYLATAHAGDAEMADRIRRHREDRGGRWQTVEEPLALAERLAEVAAADRAVLVDCLTLWLSNLMQAERDVERETERLVRALPELPGRIVLVSNEVGLGIVPDNPLARRFRDAAGRLHQSVAAAAHSVLFVAAGLPVVLKSPES